MRAMFRVVCNDGARRPVTPFNVNSKADAVAKAAWIDEGDATCGCRPHRVQRSDDNGETWKDEI